MFSQSCFIYWAYVPLSHCQENWILERFHHFTPLKFSFLPFSNSENSLHFYEKVWTKAIGKALVLMPSCAVVDSTPFILCIALGDSIYSVEYRSWPTVCNSGLSLFHGIQKLTCHVHWETLFIPWNTETHLPRAIVDSFYSVEYRSWALGDSLYFMEYRNSPTMCIGGSLYFQSP